MKDVHELEVYSSIKDFPNYLVTNNGRVLSLKDNKGKRRIKELKPSKKGYSNVNLYKNGKCYSKRVHRLVAQAFIPNPDNKPQVNHIDENKANNHVSNLEWCTCKENVNHGTHNERLSKTLSDGRLKGKNNPFYGKNHSYETKAKLSKSHTGKKHTEEAKRKMTESHKGKNKGVNNYKAKSIIGFKINGCNIKYYKCIKESEKDGFHHSAISSCCKGKGKSHKGYTWYYTDEFFNKIK